MKLTSERLLAGLCGVRIMGVSVFCTSLYFTVRESLADTPVAVPVLHSPNPNYEFLVGATAWQLSAESNALMMQAFATALPGAVSFLSTCVQSGIEVYYITNRYDQGYKVGRSDSPGSYDRSKSGVEKGLYVNAQGKEIGTTTYQVFGKSMYDITLETMRSPGFPIDDQHLIVNDIKQNGSSKAAARVAVIDSAKAYPNGQRADENSSSSALELSCDPHEAVTLFGDSINGFTDAFSDSSLDAVTRTALTQTYAQKWGDEWIVLPNAMHVNMFNYAGRYGFDALLKHFTYTAS